MQPMPEERGKNSAALREVVDSDGVPRNDAVEITDDPPYGGVTLEDAQSR
jgi:hypothetical protein